MSKHALAVEVRSAAPPSAVFALLSDGTTWPSWGGFESFTLERRAPQGQACEGVGAVRRLTSRSFGRRTVSREEVNEYVPERRLAYTLLSGLPLRGYHGLIELEPVDGGTLIRWSSRFEAAPVGQGWFYTAVLRAFIGRAAAGLARAAVPVAQG